MRELPKDTRYLMYPYEYDILRSAAQRLQDIEEEFGEDFKEYNLSATYNNIFNFIKDKRIRVNLG